MCAVRRCGWRLQEKSIQSRRCKRIYLNQRQLQAVSIIILLDSAIISAVFVSTLQKRLLSYLLRRQREVYSFWRNQVSLPKYYIYAISNPYLSSHDMLWHYYYSLFLCNFILYSVFTIQNFILFAGLEKINFSGGEPFIHDRGDFLGKLVQYCKHDLQLPSVSIVSNGSMIREKWFQTYGKMVFIFISVLKENMVGWPTLPKWSSLYHKAPIINKQSSLFSCGQEKKSQFDWH